MNDKYKIRASRLSWSLHLESMKSPMLQMYPELDQSITTFSKNNLNHLSLRLVKEYIDQCLVYIMEYIPPDTIDDTEHEHKKMSLQSNDILYQFKIIGYELECEPTLKNDKHQPCLPLKDDISTDNIPRTNIAAASNFIKLFVKNGGISISTVARWMKELGFEYREAKKTFYTDNHEHPNTVAYRECFVNRYIS